MSRLVKLIHKNFFFYMGNKDTRKAGIYVKELVNQIMWTHDKQVKNKLPKIALFNTNRSPSKYLPKKVVFFKKSQRVRMSVRRALQFYELIK